MDASRFDALAVALARARARRAVVRVGASAALAVVGEIVGRFGPAEAAGLAISGCVPPGERCGRSGRCCDGHCRRNRCRCGDTKRACGRRCIPIDHCCTNNECDPNERCRDGACEPCLAQGTACTADAQCCTGICDLYTNKCQQVRVNCEDDEGCPGGRCCGSTPNKQCLYETATQRECEPGVSCGYLLCGDRCSDLGNGDYQYCGFDGSAACRNGRCCCPQGIPLADCPDIDGPEPDTLLPRCE